ncbi:MAG: hypothetical protein M0Z66_04885 [Thermaerobacter sp.]|nr:hypothetical protein [Thermaerobacter sp.]
MLDPAYPLQAAQRSAALGWDLDVPAQRDILHRLVALLAETDCAVAERFLRHLVATSRTELGEPVIVVLGPLPLGPLEALADELCKVPGLLVRHGLARQGFYRLDGQAEDPEALCGHLAQVSGVAEVRRISGTIYVLPRPLQTGPGGS